jgi:hypothetical protein
MSSQETKRQHYVPKSYLNKFGTIRKKDEYQVFASLSDNLKKVFPANTSKICVQTDLYTLSGETEEERQLIENFYGKHIESNYEEMYNILTNDSIFEIDQRQKDLIIATVITLLYRVTKWINTHHDVLKRGFIQAIHLAQSINKDYFIFQDEKIQIKGKDENQLLEEYKLKHKDSESIIQLQTAMKLISLRSNDNISVTKINNQEFSFITSDNPIVLFNFNDGTIAPFDPSNIISMTLNGQYKLVLRPNDGIYPDNLITRLNHDDFMSYTEMLTTNYEQFKNAERFIIGDEHTIKNFEKILEIANKPCEATDKLKEEAQKLDSILRQLGLKK